MSAYQIKKENGRIIVKDEFGQRINSESIPKAIEMVKNTIDIDYWERQEIISQLKSM